MHWITGVWNDLEPYILQGFLGGLAVFGLVKDWRDYGEKIGRARWLVLSLTVAVTLLAFYETHNTRRETRIKEQKAEQDDARNEAQIEALTKQVEGERIDSKVNTAGFRQSFAALYKKYSELAAKTQNEDLLRELAHTQRQLKDTESKLEQPKATLTAGFWKVEMEPKDLAQETRVSRNPDGSVSVDIMVVNLGDTAALSGAYTIRICKDCKYAKEPAGVQHFPGSMEQDRQAPFERLLAKTGDERKTLEITPPPTPPFNRGRFEIDVIYSCVNCVADKIPLWVNFQ